MSTLIWDRHAQAIATMNGDGCYRLAIVPSESDSPVVFGLGDAGDTPEPAAIAHGFLVRDGCWCIIEAGQQTSAMLPLPLHNGVAGAVVFRIYRVSGMVHYALSTAPASVYIADGWSDALWAEDDTAHERDFDPYAPSFTVSTYWTGLGQLMGVSNSASVGEKVLLTAFARPPFDPYGDEMAGAVYGAMLTQIAQVPSASATAYLPAIDGWAGDFEAWAEATLPALRSAAGDFSGNYAVSFLPALTGSGHAAPQGLDFGVGNFAYGSLPALTVPFEAKLIPASLPALKSQAGDFPAAVASLPALQGWAGNVSSGAYGELPALRGSALEEYFISAVHGAVPIYLRVAASSVVTDPSHLPTQKLQALLGIEVQPYGENELRTAPLSLCLSVAGRVFGERVLPTKPLKIRLSISSSGLFKEALLPTLPLQVILAGSIKAQAEAVLQTQALVFALGGRLGAAAIGQVFCMNAATGGTTEYTGYAFNSVAKIGGRYYGANEQGLFLLEGETDNGAPIAANFGFGQLDFGAAQMKTLSYCYLGTKAGQMRLTIDALVCGKPAQFSYPSRRHGATMRGVRFDLGRGMKSTYVMPTFSNIDGNDFEVDTVRFMAAGSSRRIQK